MYDIIFLTLGKRKTRIYLNNFLNMKCILSVLQKIFVAYTSLYFLWGWVLQTGTKVSCDVINNIPNKYYFLFSFSQNQRLTTIKYKICFYSHDQIKRKSWDF